MKLERDIMPHDRRQHDVQGLLARLKFDSMLRKHFREMKKTVK